MLRRLGPFLVLSIARLTADSPALTLEQQRLPSPAPVGAHTPRFIAGTEFPTLRWIEPDPGANTQSLQASWQPAPPRWTEPKPFSLETPDLAGAPDTRFPDGSQLRVFFPQKDGRVLDLHTQRLRSDRAGEARPLSADTWPASATPAQPPLVIARDARALTVWINVAEKSPRLFAALSTNAGEQFFLPVRIDDGRTPGHATAVMLRDGSSYIAWLEAHGPASTGVALWLRRLSPAGDLSVPVLLSLSPAADALRHPQLAVLKDYDTTPAQLLLAHELASDGTTQVAVSLLKLPPAETFLQGRPCLTCPPDDASKAGHALFGRVKKIHARTREISIQHEEIPGILPAGKTTFRIDDATLTSLRGTVALHARIERRNGVWWLFDARAAASSNRP